MAGRPQGTPKTGGRKTGTPNKEKSTKKTCQEKAIELGVDPFEVLLHFTSGNWKALGYLEPTITRFSQDRAYEVDVISPQDRLNAAKEACKYIYPVTKAVELSGSLSGTVSIADLAKLRAEVEKDKFKA